MIHAAMSGGAASPEIGWIFPQNAPAARRSGEGRRCAKPCGTSPITRGGHGGTRRAWGVTGLRGRTCCPRRAASRPRAHSRLRPSGPDTGPHLSDYELLAGRIRPCRGACAPSGRGRALLPLTDTGADQPENTSSGCANPPSPWARLPCAGGRAAALFGGGKKRVSGRGRGVY
jgi:hypothetical protein